MNLTDHSLRQLDEGYIQALEHGAVRDLCVRLLADLKEARERLRQNPDNSSLPPSSRAPWERGSGKDPHRAEDQDRLDPIDDVEDAAKEVAGSEASPLLNETPTKRKAREALTEKRKAGKQIGQPGHGRTQKLVAHEEKQHRPLCCAGCGHSFAVDDPGTAYTAFQTVDLHWGDPQRPGLTLHVTDHRYFECVCGCGHKTRAAVPTGEVGDPLFEGVALSEWRLVAPGLAALIVCLAMRFRMSHAKIREFLWEWLALSISVGTISKTIHEAGAAVAPAEEELIQAVRDSDLGLRGSKVFALLASVTDTCRKRGHAPWRYLEKAIAPSGVLVCPFLRYPSAGGLNGYETASLADNDKGLLRMNERISVLVAGRNLPGLLAIERILKEDPQLLRSPPRLEGADRYPSV